MSSPLNSRFNTRWALLILATALAVIYHRVLLGEVFFWGLPALQFIPWREYGFDLLRGGSLPLWNSYNGAGAPLLANYQSALLYPLNWFGLVLPLAWTTSLIVVVHLFIGGWGMAALTRRIGALPLGQGLAALAFGLTTYLVARLHTFPMVDAAIWLPWLLWAAHGVLMTGRRRDAAWLALFTALLLLAGHAQTAWYSLLLVALYSLWRVIHGAGIRRLIAVGLAVELGAGIAALQLLATAELLAASQRSSGVTLDFALNFSLDPARLLNLFSPNVLGNPGDGSYHEPGYFFEYGLYVGLIPLISALAAIIAWIRTLRAPDRPAPYRDVPFWLGVVLIAIVFAMGRFTTVFPFLYEHVPTFDLFQAPVRWLLWAVAGLSVLAAIGVSAWGRDFRAKRWTRRLIAVCLALLFVTLLIPLVLPGLAGNGRGLLRAMQLMGLIGLLAGWLTLRQPDPAHPRYRRWALLVLAITAVDLGYAAWGLNPTIDASFYTPDLQPAGDYGRAYWPRAVEDRLKFTIYFPASDYRAALIHARDLRETRLPDLNLIDREPLLNNFDPLLIDIYAAYVDLAEVAGRSEPMMRAAGVTEILPAGRARFEPPSGAARAWLVPSVCWHEDQVSLEAALTSADWNPYRQVHILGTGGCGQPAPETAATDTVLFGEDPNRVEIDVRAVGDRWLVLADTDYPGWSATVDGRSVPIYRANLAFRAVQVSPGEHTIVFEYHPWWLVPGAVVSLISLAVLILLFALRDRQNTPVESG